MSRTNLQFASDRLHKSFIISTAALQRNVTGRRPRNGSPLNASNFLWIAAIATLLSIAGCTSAAVSQKCAKLTDSLRDLAICKRIENGLVAGTTLDYEPDHFRVRRCTDMTIGVMKKAVPVDLLAYGFNNILGVPTSYPYYDRILLKTRAGIQQAGCVYVDTLEKGKFLAAMISLSTKNVVMFRYMGPNAWVHYDSGEDIDIVERPQNAE